MRTLLLAFLLSGVVQAEDLLFGPSSPAHPANPLNPLNPANPNHPMYSDSDSDSRSPSSKPFRAEADEMVSDVVVTESAAIYNLLGKLLEGDKNSKLKEGERCLALPLKGLSTPVALAGVHISEIRSRERRSLKSGVGGPWYLHQQVYDFVLESREGNKTTTTIVCDRTNWERR